MNPFTTLDTLTTEPASLTVGSYVQWRKLLDYDDATYSLAYRFTALADSTTQTIAGTFDATNEWWTFEVASVALAAWTVGEQRVDLVLTRLSDSETAIIATLRMDIFASTDDRRTHAEVMVSKIESLLSGRADSDVETYSIKSRSITKMSVKELREWREYYVAEVARTGGSTTNGNRPKSNTVRVRFT